MEQSNNHEVLAKGVTKEMLAKVANKANKEMLAKVVNVWCHNNHCYFIGTPGTFPTSRAHIRSYLSTPPPPQALAGSNNTIIRPRRPQVASSHPNPQL